MWPTEDARGGAGRARSVAEGRERDDFWIQKSVRDQLFTLFGIFKGKVRKPAGKKGGGLMMDFFLNVEPDWCPSAIICGVI